MLNGEIFDFISSIETTSTPSQLWRLSAAFLERQGLTHTIYTIVDRTNPRSSRAWTSLPAFWQQRYLDEDYRKIDPYYRYCCRTFQPMGTGPEYLDRYEFLNADERKIINEGGEAGFRSGFTVPVRLVGASTVGGWNFGSALKADEFEPFRRHIESEIRLAAFYIHEQIERILSATPPPKEVILTPRERDCLCWLAKGFRTAAIADRLGIAEITVHLHFRSARSKLDAATREEALAKAIMFGVINP